MEWWKKFFGEPPAVIALIFTSGLIGLVVGIANGIVLKRHGEWSNFFSAIATGIVVALIVGLGIDGYVQSQTMKLAIIGACTVISDDIIAGLKALGSGVRSDPLGALTRIIDALRGRPTAPKDPQ